MVDDSRSKQAAVGSVVCGALAALASVRSSWKVVEDFDSPAAPVAAVGVDQPNPASTNDDDVKPTGVEGWPVVVVPAEGGVYCSPDLVQGCVFFEPTNKGVTQ